MSSDWSILEGGSERRGTCLTYSFSSVHNVIGYRKRPAKAYYIEQLGINVQLGSSISQKYICAAPKVTSSPTAAGFFKSLFLSFAL